MQEAVSLKSPSQEWIFHNTLQGRWLIWHISANYSCWIPAYNGGAEDSQESWENYSNNNHYPCVLFKQKQTYDEFIKKHVLWKNKTKLSWPIGGKNSVFLESWRERLHPWPVISAVNHSRSTEPKWVPKKNNGSYSPTSSDYIDTIEFPKYIFQPSISL